MSLIDAAGSGDRLIALQSLRDVLARQIECAERPSDVASLSKQLRETLGEIDRLGAGVSKEGSALDEFTKRLAERRSPSSRKSRSAG